MAVSRCLTSVELFAEDIVARMSVCLHLDQENVGCKIACIAMQDRAYAFHRPGADGQSGRKLSGFAAISTPRLA
jgi:hypothetical protein